MKRKNFDNQEKYLFKNPIIVNIKNTILSWWLEKLHHELTRTMAKMTNSLN